MVSELSTSRVIVLPMIVLTGLLLPGVAEPEYLRR